MSLTSLPSAAEIRTESRLTPSQVNPLFTSVADLEADITSRIEEQASVVEQRLMIKSAPWAFPFSSDHLAEAYPRYTADERSSISDRQQTNAGLVVELFTLSDLYLTAGQANPDFLNKARYYQQRGNDLLAALETEVGYISNALSATDPAATPSRGAATVYTGRGTYRSSSTAGLYDGFGEW